LFSCGVLQEIKFDSRGIKLGPPKDKGHLCCRRFSSAHSEREKTLPVCFTTVLGSLPSTLAEESEEQFLFCRVVYGFYLAI